MYKGYAMAIDGDGNIWVVNGPGGTTTSPYYNSVAEISPAGMPLANVLSGATLGTPRGIAIDTSNNVWVVNNAAVTAGSEKLEWEYTAGGGMNSYNYTSGGLYGVAIDGNNNVFFTTASSNKLAKIAAGTASGTTIAAIANTGSNAEALAIDPDSGVWASNFGGSSVSYFKATCSTTCTYPSNATSTAASVASAFGIAIDKNGIPWVANSAASGEVTKVDLVNGNSTSAGGTGRAGHAGLCCAGWLREFLGGE